jgi:ABC-2 type transport system permease protein
MTITTPRRTATVSGPFTGTFQVLRIDLRRDRFILPLWILGLGLPWAQIYVGSTAAAYPDLATRTTAVTAINSNSVMVALYGPAHNATIGSLGLWKAAMFTTLIAVATILTVIRHSRAEEDSDTGEIIAAGAIGRLASLAAAVLVATTASVCVALVGALNLLTQPIPASGAFCFSASVAASGIVFGAVAAIAIQLTSTARQARGLALATLAVAFAIRAVGDVQAPALSWFSPLGWCSAMRPFAGDRWGLLAPLVTAAIILIVLAFRWQQHRDFSAPAFLLPIPRSPLHRNAASAASLSRRGLVHG